MSDRTKDQAHEANNAVIAIAKDAAERYGVELLLAVATPYDSNMPKGQVGAMLGVDHSVSSPVMVPQLAGLICGVAAAVDPEVSDDARASLIERFMAFGHKHAETLLDRNVIDESGMKEGES